MSQKLTLEIKLKFNLSNYDLSTLYCCSFHKTLEPAAVITKFENNNFVECLKIQSAAKIMACVKKELSAYGFKRSMYLASNSTINKIIKQVTLEYFDQNFTNQKTNITVIHQASVFDIAIIYCIQYLHDCGEKNLNRTNKHGAILNNARNINDKDVIKLIGDELRDFGYMRYDHLLNQPILQPLFENIAELFSRKFFS